jgi:hypothetical protein
MCLPRRNPILPFFLFWGFVGVAFCADSKQAKPETPLSKTVTQLRTIQEALAQGKLAEAKAACDALLQRTDVLEHHRWEAKERLQEIQRREKGLPARDAAVSRMSLPRRPKPTTSFFVAPDGNDANSGTKQQPFRTIQRARDAVRAIKASGPLPAGGIEVCLQGGEYPVTQTLELTAQDSGTGQSPVVYRAAEGQRPCFRGGIRLTGFQPVGNTAILARLPEESRGKVLCVDLKPLGVKDLKPLELGGFSSGRGFKTHPTQELFFDGRAMPLARWPNQGNVAVSDIVVRDGEPLHGRTGSKTGLLKYEGDRPERWMKENDAWLYGYWFFGWADSYERIASIDPAKHEIALAPPYATYGYCKGQPFHAVNVLAEIDMPGEWYLDRKSSVLYFWPPSDPAKATVELSLADAPFVQMKQVSYVVFEGITWELGGGDAIHMCDGDHCLLAGCTVRHFAGDGVTIAGGTDHGVLSCTIHSLGRGGTVVSGGDRKTLTPGRHFIENCEIYDLSRIDRTYTPAIAMSGVGNRIAHNSLHDIPSSAIGLGGNDQTVEFNEVYRVVLESDDQGGVDMYGDPTFRGNVIRYNAWHHIGNWRQPDVGLDCGQAGVRLDDAISGVLIYGNVFFRASSGKCGFGGVQIHGGKDNIVDNNVFIDCRSAVSLSPWSDQRWKEYVGHWIDRPEIDRALYLTKYPALAAIAENANANLVMRNLVVQCGEMLRRNNPRLQNVDNLATADNPGFRDAARGDFQVPDASPAAAKIGFRPIPCDEIGLYVDAFRKELPPRALPEAK